MDPIQTTQNSEQSRAKALGTGEQPLPQGNVLLGLPSKPTPSPLTDISAISAPAWNYTDLISQKRVMADVTIGLTTSGIVWSFHNDWKTVCETFIKTLDPLFVMKSWTINFEFNVQSNFQQLGQIVVFYTNIPQLLESYHFNLTTPADATDPALNYLFQTQMPHIKFPMGQDSKGIFELKWLSPLKASFGSAAFNARNSADVPNYDMGTLCMAVPWPMEVSTGVSPQLSVRIYGYLTDVTYGGYIPNDNII